MFASLVEDAIVGAPDWFLSGAVSAGVWRGTTDGGRFLVAFSSKPYVHIFLVTVNDAQAVRLSYVGQLQAHHERISGLSLCDSDCTESNPQLFTCGFDGLVRQWVYIDQEWLLNAELNVRELNDSLLPTCISSSLFHERFLVFIGTNKGHLIVWCISAQANEPLLVSKKFENESALTCAWESSVCVSDSIRVAVGYKMGVVGVYNYHHSSVTSTATLIQLTRVYAHEKDLCHVIWRPTGTQTINALDANAELLTVGRDQLIKLWSIDSSWCIKTIKVPGNARTAIKEHMGSGESKKQSTGAPWISACWLPPASPTDAMNVVFSGLRGELYSLSCAGESERMPLVGRSHSMLIFSIVPVSGSKGLFVSVGQDRQVLLWCQRNRNELTYLSSVPTLTSGIFALSQPNHGHGPLAVGTTDGTVMLWRFGYSSTNESNAKERETVLFWPRGLNGSSITALAWHPSMLQETLLAYGTESGCVDLIDCSKISKNASHKVKDLPFAFGSTVYRVAWGPLLFDNKSSKTEFSVQETSAVSVNEEAQDDRPDLDVHTDNASHNKFSFYVYSVSRGKLFCHMGFQRPPNDITLRFPIPPGISHDEWVNDKRSDLCFLFPSKEHVDEEDHPDPVWRAFSCIVAVGFRSGCVDLYGYPGQSQSANPRGKLLHPICRVKQHTKGINCLAWSFSRYWLAIASNESFITVTDLSETLKQAEQNDGFQHLTTCLARLDGHGNRVTCLDWSPHDPNLLVSGSFDGTANVWRIGTEEGALSVANFRGNCLRLFACSWSRRENDLVYSGGELCHLFSWRPSKMLHKKPPNCRRLRPPPKKLARPGTEVVLPTTVSVDMDMKKLAVALDHESNAQVDGELSVVKSCEEPRPVIPEKPVLSKKSHLSSEKRKRPSLFPHFLTRASTERSSVQLELCPPIYVGSKFAQILHVLKWMVYSSPLSEPNQDLLFLLPCDPDTRPSVVHFVKNEAQHHLMTHKNSQLSHGAVHLDAYCMLQFWLGCPSVAVRVMQSEMHLPFWLLWAVQLSQATAPSFCTVGTTVDLLGEKVKEIMCGNPDVLLSSTLLVCAGRCREAVDLLISHDRVKDALVLARLRLDPREADDVVQKCVSRITERRLANDIPLLGAIHALGERNLDRVCSLIHNALISVAPHAGSEVDQLVSCWVELNILITSNDSVVLSNSFVRLAYNCLLVGIQLPVTNRSIYFRQWLQLPLTSPCYGFHGFRLLLEVGLQFSEIFEGNISDAYVLNSSLKESAYLEDVAKAFRDVARDRQPSNLPDLCLVQLTVDYCLCLLSVNDSDSNDDLIRFEGSLRRYITVAPKESVQLIGGLLLTPQKTFDTKTHLALLLSSCLSLGPIVQLES